MHNRDAAAINAALVLSAIRESRPVWTNEPPAKPGYYWVRDSKRDKPQVVDVRMDYSEKEPCLVVQEGNPADRGVKYLLAFHGCQGCGPLEIPYES